MDAYARFRYTVKADVPEWRNGRRGGLKNRCLTTCEFDSRLGHHSKPTAPHTRGRFRFPSLFVPLANGAVDQHQAHRGALAKLAFRFQARAGAEVAANAVVHVAHGNAHSLR